MDTFGYLRSGLKKALGKKLNDNQTRILREVSNEYDKELKESLDREIESLSGRIKAMESKNY